MIRILCALLLLLASCATPYNVRVASYAAGQWDNPDRDPLVFASGDGDVIVMRLPFETFVEVTHGPGVEYVIDPIVLEAGELVVIRCSTKDVIKVGPDTVIPFWALKVLRQTDLGELRIDLDRIEVTEGPPPASHFGSPSMNPGENPGPGLPEVPPWEA